MPSTKPNKPTAEQVAQKMCVVDEEIEEATFSKKKIKDIKEQKEKDENEEAAKKLLKEYNLDEALTFESDPLIDSFDIIDED